MRPPGGDPPPESVTLDDATVVDLRPLAVEICERYRLEFPDELARYGPAGHEWCVHDHLHLLDWGYQELDGHLDMVSETAWLARVLESRDFPLVRLVRCLELGAEVLAARPATPRAAEVARVWARTSSYVASHGTFLD